MPISHNRKASKQTERYRQMMKDTPTLCKSQVYNDIYGKIKREGRLNRFLATIQYCSSNGMDINKTVKFICDSFPCYIDNKQFTADCFKEMLKSFGDVAEAWGYGKAGDMISDIIIKNRALHLIEKTDSMEDIQIYKQLFDNVSKDKNDNSGTVINFNLKK